jgi:group I intron endonuclease
MYVGLTSKNPEDRWKNGHNYKGCPYFNNAIDVYGWDGFDHEIIASNLTEQEALRFEELLIQELNTTNPDYGYNIRPGGEYSPHSEETKLKMSRSAKGRVFSDEWKRAMSIAAKGKKMSEDARKKMSEAKKGKTAWNKGKRFSEETCKKMRESAKSRPQVSEETRKKKSEIFKNRPLPEGMNPSIVVYSPELDMSFDSMRQAGEFVGVGSNAICMCCNGKHKTAGVNPNTGERCTWIKITKEEVAV